MIRTLDMCDEIRTVGHERIHLCRLEPGTIRSVTFGYNFDAAMMAEYGAYIRAYFDTAISIHWADASRVSGRIELRNIL